MLKIKDGILNECNTNEEIVVIPDNVHTIYPHAFKGNNKVEKIIGNNVKEIYYSVFEKNHNLNSIEFPNLLNINNFYGCDNLSHILVNSKTLFHSISKLHPKLKVDILNKEELFSFEVDNNIINEVDYLNNLEDDFFMIYIDRNNYKYTICNLNNEEEINIKDQRKLIDTNTLLLNALSSSIDRIKILPEHIMNDIYDNEYVIRIFNTSIVSNGQVVAGCCSPMKKEIIINAEDVNNALIHELAHAYDFINNLSKREEFINLFEIECNNLYTINNTFCEEISIHRNQHFRSTPKEFFAETFQMYFINNEKLGLECPLTCTYFNELFKTKTLFKSIY